MVYATKRSKNRCPTHPGALLRDDIIPATGRTKAEIAGLLGISRQHLYASWGNESWYLPPSRCASASCSAMALGSGPGCRVPTIRGTRSGPRTSVAFLPSRLKPPETCTAKCPFPRNFHRKVVPTPVS
jgi:hypothetical protein